MTKADNSGFSLIELIVVVAIIVALLAIATPMLIKYVKKYNIEKEISDVYGALSSQRFKSMNTGISHGVIFDSSKKYTTFIFDDKNYNLTFDGVLEEKNPSSKSLKYALSRLNGAIGGTVILFDSEGIAKDANWKTGTFTIYINYPARYNCVVASPGGVKMGVLSNNVCKVK